MENADTNEVFKRLSERETRFLDEAHRELQVPELPEPLFLVQKEGGRGN
jgi:hypothetical protein